MVERLTGAHIVWRSLREEGVEVVFGFPGGAVIPLYDALPDYPGIRHVLVRNEAGAAFAACGYALASRKVGVCVATSGPGATNLVTGIASAHMDSLPVVAITGQVALPLVGRDAFQGVDIVGITTPITKDQFLVEETELLAPTLKRAFYLARSGRPGPVLVDVPKDIFEGSADFSYPNTSPRIRGYGPQGMESQGRLGLLEKQVDKAISLIEQSKKPVLIVGGGIISSGAYEELEQFVDKTGIPVVTTLMGIGGFPRKHPLCLRMLGMHGTPQANKAVNEADLLLVIGARFGDRSTATTNKGLAGFAQGKKVIHIDIDPAEIGKNVPVDVPIVGGSKASLIFLNSKIGYKVPEEWRSQVESLPREQAISSVNEAGELEPRFCIRSIYEITGGKATIVADVGQNQMWAAQEYYAEAPNRFITGGGLASMGGWPMAIGAQIARPGELVWTIIGDGGFQMTIQELATVVQEKLPLKLAIINNGFLGMVRQWQEITCNSRYVATPLSGPDFVKLANAYGIPAERVTEESEVKDAIARATEHNGPYLIDLRVAGEANVYPCVLPQVNHIQPQRIKVLDEKRVIVGLIENNPHATRRVRSLFDRRGFKVESLTIGESEDPGFLRVTATIITNKTGDQELPQARRQLEKDVFTKVAFDVTERNFVGQQMALIAIDGLPLYEFFEKTLLTEENAKFYKRRQEKRDRLEVAMSEAGASFVKIVNGKRVIKIMAESEKITEFIAYLRKEHIKIKDYVRSGLMALEMDD